MSRFAIPRKICYHLLMAFFGSMLLSAQSKTNFHFNLYASAGLQWFSVNRSSIWNPENYFSIPENENRLSLNPECRLSLNAIKASLSPYLTVDSQGKTKSYFREAKGTLTVGKFEATAGKALMKLGTGYMFTLISVITPAKTVVDPEDSLRSQQGVFMAKVDYYRESWSLSAIAFKKNNWRNFALFAYTSWKSFDLYGLLYYPEYRKLEGGLAVSATVGSGLEIHGEAMLHRRSPVLTHRVYAADDPLISYDEWPLYQPLDRLSPEFLCGGNLSLKGNVSLIGELYHRSWGLSKSAWNNLKSHFLFNMQKNASPFGSMNVGADMEILQAGSQGLMRDYFFARICKNLGKTDIAAIAFINLADRSLMLMADLNIELADGISMFIRPIFFTGKTGSEFAESFYSSMIQIGFTAVL